MNPWLIEQMLRDRLYRPQSDPLWTYHNSRYREYLWDAWLRSQVLRATPECAPTRHGPLGRALNRLGILLTDCGQWIQHKYPLPPCCPPAPIGGLIPIGGPKKIGASSS